MLPAWDTERSNGLIVVSAGSRASAPMISVKVLFIDMNEETSSAEGVPDDWVISVFG